MKHHSVVSYFRLQKLVNEDIVGLDVFVDDAFPMEHSEPFEDAEGNLKLPPIAQIEFFLLL